MKILRLSKDLVLAFGLQWEQHDALSGSEHQAIRAWRAKGLRESARYNLPGGRVYGLVPANGSHDEKATSYKGMLAGAAVLATHPELRDATGMVFFEIREGDHLSVVCVGLREGLVVLDRVVSPDQVGSVRSDFLRDHLRSSDRKFHSWGDVHESTQVETPFALANLTPSRKGGRAIRITALRSSRTPKLLVGLLGLVTVGAAGWYGLEISAQHSRELAALQARAAGAPTVLYAQSVEQWMKRKVHPVGRQDWPADPVYRPGLAVGERVLRELRRQAARRVPTPGDLILAAGGADRDWPMAEHLQPCPAAFVVGLPAARACQLPGSGLPATHGHYHAVASQLARSKIPVRSATQHGRSDRCQTFPKAANRRLCRSVSSWAGTSH